MLFQTEIKEQVKYVYFHGKEYSRRSSPIGFVFKKEDAKGHMQEGKVQSFTWEKNSFQSRIMRCSWKSHDKLNSM